MIGFCVPADEQIGPGDRFIVGRAGAGDRARRRSRSSPRPTWSAPTGRRAADDAQLLASWRIDWAEIVPVSAVAGDQVELLADLLVPSCPRARRSTRTAS